MLLANTLRINEVPAMAQPAIVTVRHPYLFTNAEENGPKRNTKEV